MLKENVIASGNTLNMWNYSLKLVFQKKTLIDTGILQYVKKYLFKKKKYLEFLKFGRI